jgi:hypothetical protein
MPNAIIQLLYKETLQKHNKKATIEIPQYNAD